jgi:hypothetical protein
MYAPSASDVLKPSRVTSFCLIAPKLLDEAKARTTSSGSRKAALTSRMGLVVRPVRNRTHQMSSIRSRGPTPSPFISPWVLARELMGRTAVSGPAVERRVGL